MNRAQVRDLYYITDVANLASIAQLGLLCHQIAESRGAISIANEDVQSRRARKMVQGLPLHAYVCMYLNPRNAMLFEVVHRPVPRTVVVLRIHPDALDLPGAMVSDRNAATARASFWPLPDGLANLDVRLVMASSWDVADPREKQQRKELAQAEVLVPFSVPVELIRGIVASNSRDASAAEMLAPLVRATVNPDMFFL